MMMVTSNPLEGKTRQEKLDYFNSLQYDTLLRHKKGLFYLIIPELPIVASGEKIEGAYSDLCRQKEQLFNKMLDSEIEDEIALPRRKQNADETRRQLKVFVYKLLIVCLLLGATLVSSGVALMNKAASFSPGDIAKKIGNSAILEVEKIADAPEDVKEYRLMRLRRFLETLEPIIHEFQHAFSSSPEVKLEDSR